MLAIPLRRELKTCRNVGLRRSSVGPFSRFELRGRGALALEVHVLNGKNSFQEGVERGEIGRGDLQGKKKL